MTRMLTLFIPIRDDAQTQAVAASIHDGFNTEEWTALRTFGVLDARLTSLPDPKDPKRYVAILLCTTYQGGVQQYHKFFWSLLRRPFLALAMASIERPFELTAEQGAALLSSDNSPEVVASLDALFDAFSEWVIKNDITGNIQDPDTPPAEGQRKQFRLDAAR